MVEEESRLVSHCSPSYCFPHLQRPLEQTPPLRQTGSQVCGTNGWFFWIIISEHYTMVPHSVSNSSYSTAPASATTGLGNLYYYDSYPLTLPHGNLKLVYLTGVKG